MAIMAKLPKIIEEKQFWFIRINKGVDVCLLKRCTFISVADRGFYSGGRTVIKPATISYHQRTGGRFQRERSLRAQRGKISPN